MMHKTLTFALTILLLLGISVAVAKQAGDTIPGQWIVILEDAPLATYSGEPVQQLQSDGRSAGKTLAPTSPEVTGEAKLNVHSTAARAYREHLDRRREAVMQQARDMLGRDVRAERVYSNAINGFSTHMSESEARALAEMPGVRSVHPDTIHSLALDAGPGHIGADSVWNGLNGIPSTRGEGTVIGIIDSGINWDSPYFSDSPADSGGYTYVNPYGSQLGECSKAGVECNKKLVGVYDFTVEGTDGFDPDGHGSHVASIAAGNPWHFSIPISGSTVSFNTSGVAPRANIISYKVCYNDHPTDDDLDGLCEGAAILDAIDQAVSNAVDVVNYSIGSAEPISPWQSATAVAFRNLRAAGIVAVASAGNEGPQPGSITDPARAPWMIGVANVTHDRIVGGRADVAGVSNISTVAGDGPEVSSDLTADVIDVRDLGNDGLGCAAYGAGALAGAIALIERGICTFEQKVNHAANAGAVGVLVFNNLSGPPIGMAGLQGSGIPAVMMSRDDGHAARAAIGTASNPQATIRAGVSINTEPDWADVVAGLSSRGPAVGVGNVMKPDVAAPGTSIIGAFTPEDTSVAMLSGTSMASPHVAGAVALLRAIRPDWNPAAIHSALMTTATADPVTYQGQSAPVIARGAGRIRADEAARAGLFLPVSNADFINANPNAGGNPGSLNLPSMFDADCAVTCSFTRTVTALEDGSWQAAGAGDLDITVSPSDFTLQAGQSQTLQVEVDINVDVAGTWASGGVELLPDDAALATQVLPVGVFAVLDWADINVDANRGKMEFDIPEVIDLPRATFRTSPLVRPDSSVFDLPQDLTNDEPFDNQAGTHLIEFEVSENAMLLYAETIASTADDIDLYVGRYAVSPDAPAEIDVHCASTSPNEFETCLLTNPEPGDWWVLIQNWQGSIATSDEVTLLTGLLESADDPTLAVAGPGIHELGPLSLDLIWDQPAMKRNEDWIGAVSIGTDPDHPGNAGVVPVRLTRTAAMGDPMTALAPGVTEPVVIAGSDTRNRVFVDVPPTATSLDVTLTGDDFIASLRRLDFEVLDGVEPDTPPAPVDALDAGSASGGSLELSVSGDDLQPGRYYVRIVNESAGENAVAVTPLLTETGRIEAQYGLTGPLNRTTNQGYSWQRAGWGFIIWYTYDESGVSTFYLASAPVDEGSSVWTADLHRATSDQEEQVSTQVGIVTLTNTAPDRTVFTWRFNGAVGSEIMRPVTAPTCPDDGDGPMSWTGHWYLDGVAQGGTTMIVSQAAQAHVRYFFDRDGFPRWVITDGGLGPLDTDLSVLESRANCPYCAPVTPDVETVGTYQREFFSETEVHEITEFTLRPPLDETISLDTMQEKLSERLECQ